MVFLTYGIFYAEMHFPESLLIFIVSEAEKFSAWKHSAVENMAKGKLFFMSASTLM